jgi:uncharacterized membrane protein YbhN (UPF0104 family)
MKKKLISTAKYLFFLGLGIFLIWLSLHKIMANQKEWNEFKNALANARYWLILPVFLILSTSHILRALRWRILMQPMGYTPSLPNTFFAVMIGYLANLAVPRLGEVLKCTILAKYEKVPAEKIVGTIVAERAFDVLCLGTVFLMAMILQFDVVSTTYHEMGNALKQLVHDDGGNKAGNGWTHIVLMALLFAVIAFIVWLVFTKRLQLILVNLKKILLGVWEGLSTAGKLKQKGLFTFYTIAIWLLYIAGTWLGFYATDGTTGLGLSTAISCLAFASIGMILTPGGIGAYAILFAITLEAQQNSVDYALGYANGTLQWFAQFIIVLLVGFVCMLVLPWYNRKKEQVVL